MLEEMQEEALLYKLGEHKAIYLNASAAAIWRLCDGNRAANDIIDLLREKYPTSDASLQEDVAEAVDFLVREGALIEGQGAKKIPERG